MRECCSHSVPAEIASDTGIGFLLVKFYLVYLSHFWKKGKRPGIFQFWDTFPTNRPYSIASSCLLDCEQTGLLHMLFYKLMFGLD